MSTPHRVFVTGGTGFVGKHLIRRLIEDGMSVLALARNPNNLPDGVEQVLKSDLINLDISAAAKFLESNRVDVVIHLAAAMNFYPKDKDYLWNINVEGTKKLAQASIQAKVKKFIYISSTEAMGGRPSISEPYTEDTPCSPFFHYGSSKLAAEQALKAMAPQLRYVILRLTGVLGPEDDFAMYELIQAVSYGLFFFAPLNDGKVMFTHVNDVVEGIMCTIPDRNEVIGKTYIICLDNYMTYSEIIKFICMKLHRITPIIKLPIPVIRLLTYVLDPIMNLGKNKIFLFKPETVNRMGEDRWFSNAKAKKELGFKPQYSLQDGLEHTITHMVNKGQVCTWYISPVGWIVFALTIVIIWKVLM